jgi:hypothetical protein
MFSVLLAGCATYHVNPILFAKSEAYDLVERTWILVNSQKYDEALKISDQCIGLYAEKARELNSRCDVNNLDAYEGCQLLNDTAVCVFLKVFALSKKGKENEAKELCKELKDNYAKAYVMDKCWPWKPAEACDSLSGYVSIKPTAKIYSLGELPDNPIYKSEGYREYMQSIRQKIAESAVKHSYGLGNGNVVLIFDIKSNGTLKKVQIDRNKTTASKETIKEALNAFKRSLPFPPFPEGMRKEFRSLNFTTMLSYEAKEEK